MCKEDNDGICGIYEDVGQIGIQFGVIKQEGKYKIIHLNGYRGEGWEEGDLKAILRQTAMPNVFKADWYTWAVSTEYNVDITFNAFFMTVFIGGRENRYIKIFPLVNDNN